MDGLGRGFHVGEQLIAWGTTLREVSAMTGLCRIDGESPASGSARLACRSAHGLATRRAELSGPAQDRPVLAATYELLASAGGVSGLITPRAKRFGRPAAGGEFQATQDHRGQSQCCE